MATTFSSGDDYEAGQGISITSSPTSGIDTGSPTGGYDVLGMGIVDPAVAGRPSRGDLGIGVSQSDNEQYVAALQANVDRQLAQQAIRNLQQAGLPQQIQQGFAVGTSPYAQLSARMNLNQLPNIGLLGAGLNMLGQRTASGIMERINAGGTPVYDRTGQIVGVNSPSALGDKVGGFIEDKFGVDVPRSYAYFGRPDYDPQQGQSEPIMDKFGNIIGYEGSGFTSSGDDDGFVAPEATAVAAAQPEADPRQSMIDQGYRYPAGGIYPTQGQYMRQGLLDLAPQVYGGLLAGYDPAQFGAMNVGFRQPTDVEIYDDPYDVTGYSLI